MSCLAAVLTSSGIVPMPLSYTIYVHKGQSGQALQVRRAVGLSVSKKKQTGMAITENVKKFMEAIEKDDALKVKIEGLEGQDDAVEQAIAIAKESGFTLTEEDLNALTEEDFQEDDSEELSLDDLDSAAGGGPLGWFARELHYGVKAGRKYI